MIAPRTFISCMLVTIMASACGQEPMKTEQEPPTQYAVTRSDGEWRKVLTEEQFHILREKGTEQAFTGKYWNEHGAGTYVCAACGQPLFDADTKFESGTGWPSFFKPVDKEGVKENKDKSHGMLRTEAVCSRCGGHLGHIFNDGPAPTGLRYCINSASLELKDNGEMLDPEGDR